jgi:hypothetical protein
MPELSSSDLEWCQNQKRKVRHAGGFAFSIEDNGNEDSDTEDDRAKVTVSMPSSAAKRAKRHTENSARPFSIDKFLSTPLKVPAVGMSYLCCKGKGKIAELPIQFGTRSELIPQQAQPSPQREAKMAIEALGNKA